MTDHRETGMEMNWPKEGLSPSSSIAAARLAPHRLRILAFALDLWLVIPIAVVGGLLALIRQFFGDFGVSPRTVLVLVTSLMVGLGVMNATLAWLTQGQTMGKAHFGLVERRRATTSEVGPTAGLTRLLGRHTVGYLVVDVLGVGTLTALRLPRRRCLHDVVFDTEVVYVARLETPFERRKALEDRRQAALEEIQERWGWQVGFVKWASKIVIVVVGALIGLLTFLGVLSPKATAASTARVSSTPTSRSPSAGGLTGLAVVTTSATVGIVVTLGLSAPERDPLDDVTSGPGMAGQWLRGGPTAVDGDGDPYTISVDGDAYIISQSVSVDDSGTCGRWTQHLSPVASRSGGRIATFGGGEVVADLDRCADLLNGLYGPTDSALVVPIDRMRYDSRTDRIEFWYVPSDPEDPESWSVGPYYLHQAS